MIVTASPAAAKNLKFPPILLITMLKLYTRLFQFIGSDHMMIVLYVPTLVAFLFVIIETRNNIYHFIIQSLDFNLNV